MTATAWAIAGAATAVVTQWLWRNRPVPAGWIEMRGDPVVIDRLWPTYEKIRAEIWAGEAG